VTGCSQQKLDTWAFVSNGDKNDPDDVADAISAISDYSIALNLFSSEVLQIPDFHFKTKTYPTVAKMEQDVHDDIEKICFSVVFDDWSTKTKQFKVQLRYATIVLPSTNTAPYSDLQKSPMMVEWGQWRDSGAT
jgi:hypothetical protein